MESQKAERAAVSISRNIVEDAIKIGLGRQAAKHRSKTVSTLGLQYFRNYIDLIGIQWRNSFDGNITQLILPLANNPIKSKTNCIVMRRGKKSIFSQINRPSKEFYRRKQLKKTANNNLVPLQSNQNLDPASEELERTINKFRSEKIKFDEQIGKSKEDFFRIKSNFFRQSLGDLKLSQQQQPMNQAANTVRVITNSQRKVLPFIDTERNQLQKSEMRSSTVRSKTEMEEIDSTLQLFPGLTNYRYKKSEIIEKAGRITFLSGKSVIPKKNKFKRINAGDKSNLSAMFVNNN